MPRPRVQAIRIRIAAGAVGLDAAGLHREMQKRLPKVGYNSIRRLFNDEWKTDIPRTWANEIAHITGFDVDFIEGEPAAPLPDWVIFAKGVSRSSFALAAA
jgi:hypothetical protein